jgi:hypothetical protein
VLRPVPDLDGRYQVVGECYVHGLMFGVALLGPPPNPWQARFAIDKLLPRTEWFHDGVVSHEDPRLGPLPSEWRYLYGKSGASREELSEDEKNGPARHFENAEIKVIQEWDPRMLPEALRSRGVNIKDFVLT